MSSKDTAWVKPFLTGVVATAATFHLLPKLLSKKDPTKEHAKINSKSATTTESSSKVVMDSPSLDQRILRKAEAALQGRTSRLIVVVERCTNDHNYSAILRTVEALGVQHVYIIDPQACNSTLKKNGIGTLGIDKVEEASSSTEDVVTPQNKDIKLYRSSGQKVQKCKPSEVKDRAQHHLFAQRAVEWLEVTEFETTRECIDELKSKGYDIWSTDLSQVAVCLTHEGLKNEQNTNNMNIIPEKLAIVFGTEAVGCTAEMLDASDRRVYLPLRGFADSLNLSVATALIVHQLFTLDPTLIGSMPEEERIELRRKWYAKLASQRLLSSADKSRRRRLASKIEEMESLERKSKNLSNGEAPLNEQQMEKLAKLEPLRAELRLIEDDLMEKSLKAVEGLVLNPPQPVGDMRRADEHRATFAGKNTKKSYGKNWENMPATGYFRSEPSSTASFFLDRLEDDSSKQQ